MKTVKNLLLWLLGKKEARFIITGGVNTAVGYGAYAVCLLLGLDYSVAIVISTIIGVINSYFWNKYFTFKKRGKSAAEVLRFVLVYAVGLGLNELLLMVMIDNMGVNEYAAGVACLFVTTLVSYFGHSFFSFRERPKK